MKNTLYALLLILLISCGTDELKELNINPNTANKIPEAYQFASAQLSTSNVSWHFQMIYCSTMMHHIASLESFWAGDKYTEDLGYTIGLWNSSYPGPIKLLTDIKTSLKDKPDRVNDYSMVRIWLAYVFSRLTDSYGDIPYFDAGKGYLENKVSPKYDTQRDIYTDLLKELDQAVDAFDDTKPTFGNQDIVYQGELNQWKKLGNSLMLKLALRIADADQTKAVEYIKKAVQKGVMESNDDNCLITHDNAAELNRNKTAVAMTDELNSGTYTMGKFFIDWLNNHNDPRLQMIALPNADGIYKGMPNGYIGSTILEFEGANKVDIKTFYSKFNTKMYNDASPNILLTYPEVELMLAECSKRNFINANAQQHYNAGVKAALQLYGSLYGDAYIISQQQIDNYLAANTYNDANALQLINEQYWAVNFFNPIEAYANVRRSNYPSFPDNPYLSNATNGKLPTRMLYPVSESIHNSKAYLDAIGRLKDGDRMTSRVWWDIN